MRQLSHYSLNSIPIDILEIEHWSINERVSDQAICTNDPYCSKSTSTSHDNPLMLQTLYPILDSLDINTSNLEVQYLNIFFKEFVI